MSKSLARIKNIEIEIIKGNEVVTKTIKVKKAPLGNWKRLTDSAKKILNILPEVLEAKGIEEKEEMEAYFEQMTTEDVLLLLPDMLEVAFEEVINILSLGTDCDTKFLKEKVGADEALELFEAVIEVNNLVKVVEKGKNLMNLLQGISRR